MSGVRKRLRNLRHSLTEMDLAVTFGFEAFGVESGTTVGPGLVSTGTVGGGALPVSFRWNPLKGDHRLQAVKPYLTAGVGSVMGTSTGSFVGGGRVSTGTESRATFGGHFGGGFDVHVARSFSLGLGVGYNAMVNFAEPVAGHKNFNGLQVSLGFGWLFGKGQ